MTFDPNPSGICMCGCGMDTKVITRTGASKNNPVGSHRRFAGPGHANRVRDGFSSQEERFWSHVDRTGGTESCWLWMGATNGYGYARVGYTGRQVAAHRYAYELLVGRLSETAQLDHLCHTRDPDCDGGFDCPHRRCVNPAHLEPVTARENVLRARTAPTAINARKTHCLRGHELSGDNLANTSRGRDCRECRRIRKREYRAKGSAA